MEEGFNEWVKRGYPYVVINGTESKTTTSEVSFNVAYILIPITLIIVFRINRKRRN